MLTDLLSRTLLARFGKRIVRRTSWFFFFFFAATASLFRHPPIYSSLFDVEKPVWSCGSKWKMSERPIGSKMLLAINSVNGWEFMNH